MSQQTASLHWLLSWSHTSNTLFHAWTSRITVAKRAFASHRNQTEWRTLSHMSASIVLNIKLFLHFISQLVYLWVSIFTMRAPIYRNFSMKSRNGQRVCIESWRWHDKNTMEVNERKKGDGASAQRNAFESTPFRRCYWYFKISIRVLCGCVLRFAFVQFISI